MSTFEYVYPYLYIYEKTMGCKMQINNLLAKIKVLCMRSKMHQFWTVINKIKRKKKKFFNINKTS